MREEEEEEEARVCARGLGMNIDERYLAPMRQPKPLSLDYVLEDEEPMLTPLTESDILKGPRLPIARA